MRKLVQKFLVIQALVHSIEYPGDKAVYAKQSVDSMNLTQSTATTNDTIFSNKSQPIPQWDFQTCHQTSEHDLIFVGQNQQILSNPDDKSVDNATNSFQNLKSQQFCSIRQDYLYQSTAKKLDGSPAQSCCSSLLIKGGQDRSLELTLSIGNVTAITDSNLTDSGNGGFHKNYTEAGKILHRKEKSDTEKKILEEMHKLEVDKKNLTQEVVNYTVFDNYDRRLDEEVKIEQQPEWIVNLTSLGYGNISRPAVIDPYFPYLQLNPLQFNWHFKDKLDQIGFKPVHQSSKDKKQAGILNYKINQKCQVLLGCFEPQEFIISSINLQSSPNQTIDNPEQISMKLHPIDYLIQSYTDNGEPECLLGISTCSSRSNKACHTTLGKTFLKSFDTILDFERNQVLMRTTPKTKYQGSQDLCWKIQSKVAKKGLLEQLNDEVTLVDDFFKLLADPATLLDQVLGLHSGQFLKYGQYAMYAIFGMMGVSAVALVAIVVFVLLIIQFHSFVESPEVKHIVLNLFK